jgi:HNH endonuclease
MKTCKHCNCELTEQNAAKNGRNGKHYRNECKPCRSKKVCEYQAKDVLKRREYHNEYKRRVGIIKQWPCEQCGTICIKKYGKAFCGDRCRFLSYVIMSENVDDCWLWIGGLSRKGYGKFQSGKHTKIASRIAYELFKGIIPDGKFVCHTCDNPRCVKPAHLWIGTNSENQQDSIKKGRHRWYNYKSQNEVKA